MTSTTSIIDSTTFAADNTTNNQSNAVIVVNDNVAPTGSPTAILTGAVEDTFFSISEIDLLAGFNDANGDALSIENLVATNGTIFSGGGYGGDGVVGIAAAAAQSFSAISTAGRIFTFVPNANFNGIVNLTYDVTDGNLALANQTLSFSVSPVNDAPTGTPTATLANADLNSPYIINTSDLLTGFSDADGDALSIEGLTASNGSLINNDNGTYTFTPTPGFNGLVNLNYSVTDGITALTNQNINLNVGSVFSILPSISDEQIITSLLGNTTGLSNFQLTTSGSRQAVGLFQNDPFGFGQGIVLSTGSVSGLVGSRLGNISTSFGNPGTVPGGRDAITLDITFDASATSDQIFFQYIFGSEEFTDFSGSSFNDSSTLTLNGVNLARLTNGNTVTINNLTPSGNPATFSPDYIDNNAAGSPAFSQIALDGFTRPLGFAGTLIPGASNRLVITVQDISDGALDSAIFFRANTLGIEQVPGVVQFLSPSYTVDENNVTLATITVIRTGGDNAAASVQLNLSDGTATAPNDYLNEPITINFAFGESIKTITVPIIDDSIVESNETINLTLSNPSTGLIIGAQNTALLTILANDNIAPTGSPTATLTGATEDTAFIISEIDLLAGFSDANGDILSVTNLSSNNGSITNNENGTYTFSTNANFNGDVTLTYGVTDGLATLANQTLNFNVAAVNDGPTGLPIAVLNDSLAGVSYTINASDLLIGFSDVEGDTLSIENLVATNGILVNNGDGIYTFTPNADFIGVVNLTYDVTDGIASATSQSLSFNIIPNNIENIAPEGEPTAVLPDTNEDTALVINASDLLAGFSDADGDTLSVTNLAATNGTLVDNNNGTFTFTPEANFNGQVTLVYDVTDGTDALTEQVLSFNVLAINDAPTGSPTITLPDATEDEAFVINASDLLTGFSDVDEDTLSIVNLVASNGTLENIGNETFIFTPSANFNGTVTLTYDVSDGVTSVINQTRSLNILAVNDAPTGSPTAVLETNEDTSLIINSSELLAGFSDVDEDTLSVVNLVASNGTVIENEDGNYTFTPDADFNGEVVLTYAVSDGNETLEQSINLNVAAVNDAPTGSPTGILADGVEDTVYTINASDLLAGFSDVDGDTLAVTNLSANNGTVIDNGNGTYTFTPNANINGSVILTYDISDGTATTTGQILSFNLSAVNDAPTGSPTATLLGATEDTAFTISANDLLSGFSDIDGDVLSIVNLVASTGTLIENEDGNYTFTPNANFNGEVVLTYGVTDGIATLTEQSISFNVAAVNDAPTGSPTATLPSTAEDSTIVIKASDLLLGFNDIDGDTLSIVNLAATNGTLVNNNDGTYNFTPTADFNGIVNLTYDVTDGAITLTGQAQSFGVTPVNDAPTLQQLLEDQGAGQNQLFTFTIPSNTFADIDAGDTLTLSAALANGNPLPSWLSFNSVTQTFSGTPPLVNIGSLDIRVTATDSAGASVSDVFTLDIGLNIIGTLRADNLIGSNGFDTISGLNGNDTIDGGRGADRLDGGNGNDRLLGGVGRDTLIGGTGNDTLDGGADDDSYEASGTQAEFDTFSDTGVTGSDTLVNIGSTALTLNSFSLSNGIESIIGNNQAIIGNSNANVLNFSGVSLNNVLFIGGGSGDDSITGNGANNDLRGNNGNDIIDGGAGDDRLDGGSQNDSLLGAAGDDTLDGGSGTDTLDGGEGSDSYSIVGNQAEFDTFADTGSSGTDTLINLAGTALTLDGFTFNNGIDVINGNNQAIIGNNSGNAFDFRNVIFNNVSFVSGGSGNDSIVGTALGDNLQGGSGNDTISGENGDDLLDGGAQNDSLLGGIGDDTLVGGTGIDTLDGGDGSDTYEVAIIQAEFDLFADTGASGNDTLRNTSNSSLTLNGFSITNGLEFVDGNNRAILGNSNSNNFNFSAVTLSNVLFVDGGNGNDFLVGSAASDNLRGGSGNDTIDGGNGSDNLFGGAGNDAFIFNSSSTGIDTINDFTIGGDTLQISSTGFGGVGVVGAAGVLAAARFTTGTAATNAVQRFVYDNASGALFFDIDGNGSAAQVQIALLSSRPTLSSNSFLVV